MTSVDEPLLKIHRDQKNEELRLSTPCREGKHEKRVIVILRLLVDEFGGIKELLALVRATPPKASWKTVSP